VISVWLVSAAFGRFAVTDLVLEQRQQVVADLAARGIDGQMLVVADDENLDVAEQHGAERLERPNKPLGEKWNAGFEHAFREGADFVVYIGSDDWMHPGLFDRLPASNAILTGRQIAFLNLNTGRMQPCKVSSRWGVIPWVLPRQLLERCEFRPITTRRSWGLDNSLINGLRAKGPRPLLEFRDPHPLARVDIKSDTNITPYARVATHLADGDEISPWDALTALYPADLVARARTLSQEASCHP
jgi:glycosyltransferase involved in cell wall biosynthesis